MISTQGSTCFLCSRNACTREAISQLSTHRWPACSCVSWLSWPPSELALVDRSRDQDFPHFRRQVRTVRPSLNLVLTGQTLSHAPGCSFSVPCHGSSRRLLQVPAAVQPCIPSLNQALPSRPKSLCLCPQPGGSMRPAYHHLLCPETLQTASWHGVSADLSRCCVPGCFSGVGAVRGCRRCPWRFPLIWTTRRVSTTDRIP